MNRVFGVLLASSLAIGLGSTVSAQEFDFPGEVVQGPIQGGFVNGGFGNTYVQPPPVTGIPGNRWDMLAGPSYAEGIPYGERTFEEQRPARVAPRPRVNARFYGRAPAPYGTPLPMSRLYGDGATAPLYAPFNRHQAYGQGYELGPYGSNYYSEFWHGQPTYGIYP